MIGRSLDRGDQPYMILVHRVTGRVMLLSPTRQMRKKLGLSGRQWKKTYKTANRQAKAEARARRPKPPASEVIA